MKTFSSVFLTSHIFDILTIPFFALLIVYFYGLNEKTTIEWVLYWFGIVAFVIYSIFTVLYLKRHNYI